MLGLSAGSVAGEVVPTQTVPLNNADAPTLGADKCPDGIGDYWHFIIAPNPGGFAFVSITLALDDASTPDGDDPSADDTAFTFTGTDIIPNGVQTDNVYVEVPDGYSLGDIVKVGSSADITPAVPAVKFVLSHLCDGSGTTTTTTVAETTTTAPTTTVAETTTTVAETTTTAPTTTIAETTTTVAETTTTVAETTTTAPTTTIAETTTTLSEAGSGGPTTTGPATSTPVTQLPQTGGDLNRPLGLVGGLLLLVGALLLLTARRTAED
jgi:LPXTG-motif cell wall-anchored protein